jgi:hypothetical protein
MINRYTRRNATARHTHTCRGYMGTKVNASVFCLHVCNTCGRSSLVFLHPHTRLVMPKKISKANGPSTTPPSCDQSLHAYHPSIRVSANRLNIIFSRTSHAMRRENIPPPPPPNTIPRPKYMCWKNRKSLLAKHLSFSRSAKKRPKVRFAMQNRVRFNAMQRNETKKQNAEAGAIQTRKTFFKKKNFFFRCSQRRNHHQSLLDATSGCTRH